MFEIVVTEDILFLDSGRVDALDHRGVVELRRTKSGSRAAFVAIVRYSGSSWRRSPT